MAGAGNCKNRIQGIGKVGTDGFIKAILTDGVAVAHVVRKHHLRDGDRIVRCFDVLIIQHVA